MIRFTSIMHLSKFSDDKFYFLNRSRVTHILIIFCWCVIVFFFIMYLLHFWKPNCSFDHLKIICDAYYYFNFCGIYLYIWFFHAQSFCLLWIHQSLYCMFSLFWDRILEPHSHAQKFLLVGIWKPNYAWEQTQIQSAR